MTQTQRILSHLKRRTLTAHQAWDRYGILRLAARINELRNQGYRISTETVKKDGKSWARYRMEAA